MKGLLAALLVLVLGGLGVVLWLDSAGAPPEQVDRLPSVEVPNRERPEASGVAGDRVEPDRQAVMNALTEDQPRVVGGPGFDPATIAVAAWPNSGWLLQVLDEESGEPIQGALVWGLVAVDAGWASNQHALRELIERGLEPLDVVCAQESAYRTDANGYVRLPETAQDQVLAVRVDERRAVGFSNMGGERNTQLVVRLPKDQGIEVVDALGESAAGVPIVLDHPWLWARISRTTDEAGRLELHAVNVALANVNELLGLDDPDNLLVRVIPKETATSHLLAPEPIRFVMESRADVVVQLVGANGGAWHDSRDVVLTCWEFTQRKTADRSGLVRFQGLPVGAHVEAKLKQEFAGTNRDELSATGVVAALGLRLELHAKPHRAEISMRLLDPAGEPLADQEVAVGLELRSKSAGGSKSSRKQVTRLTDANGVLVHGFDDVGTELPENHRMDVVLSAVRSQATLRAALPPLLGPVSFPHDFGDVMLMPRQPLVAGRVVTEGGTPVAGAWVTLHTVKNATFLSSVDGFGSVLTDTAGHFSFDGQAPEGAVFLRADLQGYGRSRLTPLPIGEQRVELVLERMGSIVTSLAPGVGSEGLRVCINPVDAELKLEFSPAATGTTMSNSFGHHGEFDDQGEMVWNGLWPGIYNLQLVMEGQKEALIEWPEIVVHSGLLTRDVGMQNIDLSNFAHHVVLNVTNEAGEVLTNATATMPGSVFADPIALDDKGLDVFEWPIRVLVRAPGYQSASVELNQSVHDVILSHAPQVTLRVPENLALPPNGSIMLALKCQSINQMSFYDVANGVQVQKGLATIQLEGLGKQDVVIVAMISSGGSSSSNHRKLEALELDLDVSCDGKVIDLALTQAMVDQAFGL